MNRPRPYPSIPIYFLAPVMLLAAACGGGQPPATQQSAQPATVDQSTPASSAAETPAPAAAPERASSTPAPPMRPKPTPSMAQKPMVEETASAEPAPAPEPIVKTVPEGTVLEVAFLDALSSKTSMVGDDFRARVTKDVSINGVPVIPSGSVVHGNVTEAVSLKKIGGKAKLALEFSRVELTSGTSAPIQASFAQEGKSETKKDAATIGGATAGGAVLGRILDKKHGTKGTLLGAAIGAAAGTAIASKTEGEEVEIPTGMEVTLQLAQPTQIIVRP